jgi:hypothetical protein
MDRASRRTVNQVTMKETTKTIKDIKNVARKKFPSTKSTGDRIARAREGDIMWASISSAEASTRSPPDLLKGVGFLGFLESTASVVASAGATPSPSLQLWIVGIESRSSVTIDDISGLRPLHTLEGVGNRGETVEIVVAAGVKRTGERASIFIPEGGEGGSTFPEAISGAQRSGRIA